MKDILKVYGPLALLALVLVVVFMRFVAPAPPRHIAFAAGGVDGQYYAFAQAYRQHLARHGITVEVLETGGTVDNYARLDAGEADVALLQGGLAVNAGATEIQSLGGMFAEPFWVFVPAASTAQRLEDLRSARIAAGGEGSGTRALLVNLQTLWGGPWADPVALGGSAAGQALIAGDVDAVVYAASVEATYVQALLRDPAVRLLAMPRAEALSLRNASLAPVTLYEGVISFDPDIPARDTEQIAAIAQLGIRADLHPALQSVLLEAAEDIHSPGSVLLPPGTFPDPLQSDLSLSEEARRYYRKGPTFLRRYFSFGWANFLERAWIFLIPLLTLLIPLTRLAPPLYRWRIRRKIYVWYNDLHALEQRGIDAPDPATRDSVLEEIQALQREVGRIEVPVSYNDELYHLRSHINFVEALVRRQKSNA